jgi:single-strand DNA-binding protein
MDLNKVMIIGNLTRNPESRTTPSGQTVCNFGVATNRTWKDAQGQKQESAEFHNIVAWGKLAEICNQYLAKGRKVFLEGRLQTREWEAQDGNRKNRTEIVAENMIILDRAPATSGGGMAAKSEPPSTPAPQEDQEPQGEEEIKVENIPF